MGGMKYAALGLRGLEALASLGQVGRCIFDSVEAKELTKDAGMDLAADIAELGFLYQNLEKPSQNTVRPGGSDIETCISIVYGTLTLFTVLELLNGWGLENCGNEFCDGQLKFDDIYKILQDAAPDYVKWSGSGAYAYDELNRKLSALIVTVENSDQQVAAILRRQADQVQEGRERLAGTVLTLNGLLLLLLTVATCTFTYDAAGAIIPSGGSGSKAGALAADCGPELRAGAKPASLWLAAGAGWVTSVLEQYLLVMALTVCISAVTVASVFLGELIAKGFANADSLRDQAHFYHQAADGAVEISSNAAASGIGMPAAASKSAFSGFSATAIMSDTEVIDMPTVVGELGGLGGMRALVSASSDDGGGRYGWLAGPTTGLQTPLLTEPAPVGFDQMPGKVVELPGEILAHPNLGEQTTEQIPPLISMMRRRMALTKTSDAERAAFVRNGAVQVTAADGGDVPSSVGRAPGIPVEVLMAGVMQEYESDRPTRSV